MAESLVITGQRRANFHFLFFILQRIWYVLEMFDGLFVFPLRWQQITYYSVCFTADFSKGNFSAILKEVFGVNIDGTIKVEIWFTR